MISETTTQRKDGKHTRIFQEVLSITYCQLKNKDIQTPGQQMKNYLCMFNAESS